jgi:hypothetical protein
VGENTNPHLSFSLQVTVNRDPAGLNLAAGHPASIKSLQSKISEAYVDPTTGVAAAVSSL